MTATRALPEGGDPPPQRRSRLKRWLRRLLVLGLLIALALSGLYLGRNRFVAPFLLARLQPAIEGSLGGTLEVDRFGGSWISGLELDGMRFQRTAGSGPLVLVDGGAVAASYDLWTVLREGLAGLEKLTLRAGALVLALDSPSGESAKETDAPAKPFELPLHLPDIDARIARLELGLEAGSLTAAELAVEADADALRITARTLDPRALVPRAPSGPLELALVWRGGVLDVQSAEFADAVSIGPGPVDLTGVTDGELGWSLPVSLVDLESGKTSHLATEGSLDAHPGGGRLTLQIDSPGLDLALVTRYLPEAVPTLSGGLAFALMMSGAPGDLLAADWSFDATGDGVRLGEENLDRLRAVGSSGRGVLSLVELEVASGGNELSVQELELPLKSRRAQEVLAETTGSLVVTLTDIPGLLETFDGGTLNKPSLRAIEHRVRLSASAEAGTLRFEEGSFVSPGGTLDLKHGTLAFDASAIDLTSWWQQANLDVDLAVNITDGGELAQLFGRDDVAGSLIGDLQIAGSPSAPVGVVEARAERIQVGAREYGSAEFQVLASGDRIELKSLDARSSQWTLTGNGGYDLARNELDAFSLEAELPSIESLLPNAEASGAASISATLSGPLDALSGELAVSAEAASVRQLSIPMLDARGRLDVGELVVDDLTATVEDALVSAAGRFRPGTDAGDFVLAFERLAVSRGEVRTTLEGPATLTRSGDRLALTEVAFDGDAGRLVASAQIESGSAGTTESSLGLVFEDFDLDLWAGPYLPRGFVISPLQGRANVSWSAGGPANGPRLGGSVRLRVPALVLSTDSPALAVELSGELLQDVLQLDDLQVTAGDLGGITLRGRAPLAPLAADPLAEGPLELTVEARTHDMAAWPEPLQEALFGERLRIGGSLSLEADLGGEWRALEGVLELAGTALVLEDRSSGERIDPVALTTSVQLGKEIRLVQGDLTLSDFATALIAGNVDTVLDVSALARGELDALMDAKLAASVECDAPALAFLAGRFDSVRRLGGALTTKLALDGSLGAPILTGEATLRDADLRLASSFPALQNVSAELQFEGDEVRLTRGAGQLGGAGFELTGAVRGLVADEQGDALTPILDLRLSGDDLLLFRNVSTRVRADTRIALQGPVDALSVSGQIALTEGRYGEAIELLQGLSGEAGAPSSGRGINLGFAREGPLANMQLDLEVSATSPFRLQTNLVKGGLRPDVRVRGNGAVPLVDGSVFLEPTVVSLPSGALRVESGRVAFDAADPYVPKLELTGGMRLKGYDVRVAVSGDYDDPTVRLSSTPPLPSQDLLVLFLTGQLPEGTSSERGRGAAQSVAVYLAQDYVTRWFSGTSESEEESILTRIDLSIGNDITRSGALTTEVTYLLTERAQGTGRERYLVGEKDVYDKINFGYGIRFRFE